MAARDKAKVIYNYTTLLPDTIMPAEIKNMMPSIADR